MKRSDAFPSSYLAKDDLPQPPGTARGTIEDVRIETMPGDNKDEKPVMYFKNGSLKPFVLNQTNWTIIEEVYGDDSDNWRGQTIELYVDPNIMFAGKRTGGVRVRVSGMMNPGPDTWTLQEALDRCGQAGVDKEQLKAACVEGGFKGWNPAGCTPIAQRLIREASPSVHEPVREEDIPF